jgi:hypothetical protein
MMKAKALEKEKKYIAPDESQLGRRNNDNNSNTSMTDSVNELKSHAKVFIFMCLFYLLI